MMENAPRFGMWTQYTPSQADRDADLLDEFAKAALTGMLASEARGYEVFNREKIGEIAYDVAANMMSERARRREVGK